MDQAGTYFAKTYQTGMRSLKKCTEKVALWVKILTIKNHLDQPANNFIRCLT